jgi:hypothetical protein
MIIVRNYCSLRCYAVQFGEKAANNLKPALFIVMLEEHAVFGDVGANVRK